MYKPSSNAVLMHMTKHECPSIRAHPDRVPRWRAAVQGHVCDVDDHEVRTFPGM